jgi:trans-AT polyketide synthase/acyltransferase/oxidoreductase domain-containing protein
MSPAPEALVDRLLREGRLTATEATVARQLPMSDDICVEADSGGHTDGGVALALIPAFTRLREDISRRYGYPVRIRIGASGGLGAPEAIAAAFVLGADFVITGSVNQCTTEAGTSSVVKDMLADLDVGDTAYAPAGDMFESGARAQVVRKGTLFAARANNFYQLYRTHEGIERIDAQTRASLERSYFKRPLREVWDLAREHYLTDGRVEEIARAEKNTRHRMALIFRWYFANTTMATLEGRLEDKANFQVHCGPAMGAFNRFAAGGALARWEHRHVDEIAEVLMTGAAELLAARR